jgi:hypothetical protein
MRGKAALKRPTPGAGASSERELFRDFKVGEAGVEFRFGGADGGDAGGGFGGPGGGDVFFAEGLPVGAVEADSAGDFGTVTFEAQKDGAVAGKAAIAGQAQATEFAA